MRPKKLQATGTEVIQTGASTDGSPGETAAETNAASIYASPAFGAPAAPGDVGSLGHYRVIREIGRGAMGRVYLGVDVRLDREVALKVMSPQAASSAPARERFLLEARVAAKISHDNVVTVFEADEAGGVPFIAMQRLQGMSLDAYLALRGPPSISQILRILREAASGLDAAHRVGLVHRDVKPANLWLESPQGRVKVLDFGLAKAIDGGTELTQEGLIVGTPAFMSPEQVAGKHVDARSDLFSLGAIGYRLCAGRPPFGGPSVVSVLRAVADDAPVFLRELNPALPRDLPELIHEMLAKDPAVRPQSAKEVVERLRRAASNSLQSSQAKTVAIFGPAAADSDDELRATLLAAPGAVDSDPPDRPPWPVFLAFAFGAFLLLAGVIIVVKKKDGSEERFTIPDGREVIVIQTKDQPPSETPPRASVVDRSRDIAKHVLAAGGAVALDGGVREYKAERELPTTSFTVTGVSFPEASSAGDDDLAIIAQSPALRRLSAPGSSITDAGLAHLKQCSQLEVLFLRDTRVTDRGLRRLGGLTQLRELNIENCDVSGKGLHDLYGMKALTLIGLYGTKVTDDDVLQLVRFQNLTLLGLSRTSVTDRGLGVLNRLPNLRRVDLQHTGITDKTLEALSKIQGLEEVNLDGAHVSDAGIALLRQCRRLQRVQLRDTRATPTMIDQLHRALPQCMIVHDRGVSGPSR